jgi:predicted nucleic acid-binding protein
VIYVFDASFVGALIIPDERDPSTERMYTKIKIEDEKHAPHLLWYEIANLFKNLLRRKRYTYDGVLNFFPLLTDIHIICDFETGIGYVEKLLRLCNDYNISSYDAVYLELAGRKKAVLCTLDENLRAAAAQYGVAVNNG